MTRLRNIPEKRIPRGRASLEYPLLRDWLLDCGMPRVPKATAGDDTWLRWWKRHAPRLSALQRAKAWEAFDQGKIDDVIRGMVYRL